MSRKNLIISVPNCAMNEDLLRAGLVYSHWIDLSHSNFFDPESFRKILEENGFRIQVLTQINPILPDFIPLRSLYIPYKLAFQSIQADGTLSAEETISDDFNGCCQQKPDVMYL